MIDERLGPAARDRDHGGDGDDVADTQHDRGHDGGVTTEGAADERQNDLVEGRERENSVNVFPSSAIATAAAIRVSGAAIPAVLTSVAKPKKKLIAGAMFASVAAAM